MSMVSGVRCRVPVIRGQRPEVRGQKTDEKMQDEATFLSSVFCSLSSVY